MNKLDKYLKEGYGFYPLATQVDRYYAASFNNSQKHYKNMLIVAQNIWKELYWKTLRITKNKKVPVDMTTMTARYPADCLKLISVKVIDDCNHFQPLTHDPYQDIIQEPAGGGCGCKKCSCDSELCSYVNGISYVTEDVELAGETYSRIIKTKVQPSGDLLQEITEPFAQNDPEGVPQVVWRTFPRHVASLTVKPCGCVENTVENRAICYDTCGCPSICCTASCERTTIRVPDNKRGKFKHDDDLGLIFLFDSLACKVMLTYVSNGEECAKEIMIPEYCSEAMNTGMYYGTLRYRSGIPSYEKRAAKADYAAEVQELYEFLNPIVPHEFIAMQYQFSQW